MRTYPLQTYGQMYVGTGADTDAVHVTTQVATALAAEGVGIAIAGGAGKTAAAKGITALMSAAGVSASAPVVGWIVAAGTVLAAGIMSFIAAAKAKGIRRDQVTALAIQLNFPEAVAYPDFVFDALTNGTQWRQLKAKRLESDIAKGKGKEWMNKSQLAFLGVMEVYDRAEQRLAAGLRVAPPTAGEISALEERSAAVQSAIRGTYRNRNVATVAIILFTVTGAYLLLTGD